MDRATFETIRLDTSNPFIAREIPTPDESFVVIRFKDPQKFDVDFGYLQMMLHDPDVRVQTAAVMGLLVDEEKAVPSLYEVAVSANAQSVVSGVGRGVLGFLHASNTGNTPRTRRDYI